MMPTVLDYPTEAGHNKSIGTCIAPIPGSMDREHAILMANSIAHSLGHPCQPPEQDENRLLGLMQEVVESMDSGEMTEKDARAILAILMAADMESRFSEMITSFLGRDWSESISRLYTARHERKSAQ